MCRGAQSPGKNKLLFLLFPPLRSGSDAATSTKVLSPDSENSIRASPAPSTPVGGVVEGLEAGSNFHSCGATSSCFAPELPEPHPHAGSSARAHACSQSPVVLQSPVGRHVRRVCRGMLQAHQERGQAATEGRAAAEAGA